MISRKKPRKYELLIDLFGSRKGSICKSDKDCLYLPTSSVKFTKGKTVIWWNVKVPIDVVEDFDEYFKEIK
jgi:hypothetical protein